MKKIKFLILFFVITNYSLAQKFAYVDTDYILAKIPEYNQAQDKLDNYSKGWQEEKRLRLALCRSPWTAMARATVGQN